MEVNVVMLAFMDGDIRTVDIPDEEAADKDIETILERTFYYGQNDFQPKPMPSVSVGDVITPEDNGKVRFFLVKGVGFEELSPPQYNTYKNLSEEGRRKRAMGF